MALSVGSCATCMPFSSLTSPPLRYFWARAYRSSHASQHSTTTDILFSFGSVAPNSNQTFSTVQLKNQRRVANLMAQNLLRILLEEERMRCLIQMRKRCGLSVAIPVGFLSFAVCAQINFVHRCRRRFNAEYKGTFSR